MSVTAMMGIFVIGHEAEGYWQKSKLCMGLQGAELWSYNLTMAFVMSSALQQGSVLLLILADRRL